MANALSANQDDLGEMLTRLAQEVAVPAWERGVAFFYDYRGPCLDASRYAASLQRIVRPLLRRAVQKRPGQTVFFSVDVIEHPSCSASLVIQVAETQEPLQEAAQHTDEDLTQAELESIQSWCAELGGSLLIGAAPREGRVTRVDLLLTDVTLSLDCTAASYHGALAWLLGEPPVVFESLVRRLQRLGWRVELFPSIEAAQKALRGTGGAHPDIIIGAERYNVAMPALMALADEVVPRTAVYVTLLGSSAQQADEFGFIGKVAANVYPFSPAELHRITARALSKTDKVLSLSALPDKALGERPRALLVEDNPINQLLSTEILQLFGFEVDVAGNGKEAVEYCSRELPTIVIMDINMPVMDGLEATDRIREFERRGMWPHVPILAATAQDDAQTRCRVVEVGMDGFISKPIDLASMQREIARVMKVNPFELPHGRAHL